MISLDRSIHPCAGGVAEGLALLLGRGACPPVAWMGGKRRLAAPSLRVVGLRAGQGAAHSVWNDAGPWGRVWTRLIKRDRAEAVARVLDAWMGRDIRDLWFELREAGPLPDPTAWVAQWLVLQARAGGGVPVFWGSEELLQGSGGGRPPQPAGQRDTFLVAFDGRGSLRLAGHKGESRASATGGLVNVSTLARRVRALGLSLDQHRIEVVNGRAEELDLPPDLSNALVFLDPPYHGATGYGWSLERSQVLALADRCAGRGAIVVLCEAVPLAAELGRPWESVDLTGYGNGKPEWVTVYPRVEWRPALQCDLNLTA